MKTQKISRKDLQSIYGKVCEGWQKKIAELVLFQSGDTIDVDNTLVTEAFNKANGSQKEMLKKYFKFISGNIMDEIDSFLDIKRIARERHGVEYIEVDWKTYANIKLSEVEARRLNADRKLELIQLVLNDGWVASFSDRSQSKWAPWFERKSSGWVALGDAGYFDYCTCAGVGPYFKEEKIAIFAGDKFLDIYKEKLPA